LKNSLGGRRKDFFLNTINTSRKTPAKSMRYHTKASALIEINAPNIAVNPQMNTMK
jgi:hypothetical protein